MARSGFALGLCILAAVASGPGCKSGTSPTATDEISQAIRALMTEWELGFETQDVERVEAVFDARYWPGEFLSASRFDDLKGHPFRLLDVEIQPQVQEEYADADFRVYVEDAPGLSIRVLWTLRASLDEWLVIEEHWGSYE